MYLLSSISDIGDTYLLFGIRFDPHLQSEAWCVLCRSFNSGAVCCNCYNWVVFADISTLVATPNVGYFHLVSHLIPNLCNMLEPSTDC